MLSRTRIKRLGRLKFYSEFLPRALTQRNSSDPFCPHGCPTPCRLQSTYRPIRDFEHGRTAAPEHGTSDTIYALSTAPGRAAIAVIRISGPACLDIYRSLCPSRPLPKPRTATLRKLYDPAGSQSLQPRVLDAGALILYFPAPNTVTGEDVLELHVHGGPAIVRSLLDAVDSCGRLLYGAGDTIRPAGAGEFTKWAFYNGKLDLTQAEALGETLAAETEQQRRLAVNGADGGLAQRYEEWRTTLLYARGELEAWIDFSEDQHFDESPNEFMSSISNKVLGLKQRIEIHLRNASKGELLRNGISIALLGAPNAGKSSLLNRIVGREAAIVSAEEGTTRDIVDVSVDLNGWLCRLGDMAGLGSNGQRQVGMVEQEGIRRARARALRSDIVVVLLSPEKDKNGVVDDVPVVEEVLEAMQECLVAGKTVFVVVNKIDLLTEQALGPDAGAKKNTMYTRVRERLPMIPEQRMCMLSCRDAANIDTSTDSDPGRIQAFLRQLTDTFTELTTASTGETEARGTRMTPAEAQSYWTASLSVTHRQSKYLSQCLHHLEDFLSQSFPQSPQSQPQAQPHLHTTAMDTVGSTSTEIPTSLPFNRDSHVDRHGVLVGPNTVPDTEMGGAVDIVTAAEHLRSAADCLAKITGKGESGDVEDILGVVFEK